MRRHSAIFVFAALVPILVVTFTAGLLTSITASSEDSDLTPIATLTTPSPPQPIPADEPELSDTERFRILDERIAVLSDQSDGLMRLIELVLVPLAILTGILAIGGLVSIVLSFRTESRGGQAHDLFMTGASAQQARTEEVHAVLLDASQKTLTLVNDTLELARDASERAAKTLSQRAERLLNEISDDANRRLIQSHYHRDFESKMLKVVVEEPEIRNDILDLSQRLASIEGYLEFQEIPLTAPAYLVKGMAHHLRQDEERAIRFLERAAQKRGSDSRLTRLAYYWAGYACNNLGKYAQSAELFSIARKYADPDSALFFELFRQEEESRFFDLAYRFLTENHSIKDELHTEAGKLHTKLNELRSRATEVGAHGAAQAIATTQGNISTWLARSEPHDHDAKNRHLQNAVDDFAQGGGTLWADFGRLQARRELNPEATPDRDAYARLEEKIHVHTQKRTEPRSLTLLYLTAILCMIEQGKDGKEIEAAMPLLRRALADVDGSLTIYSQHWKANVTREQFDKFDMSILQARRDEGE